MKNNRFETGADILFSFQRYCDKQDLTEPIDGVSPVEQYANAHGITPSEVASRIIYQMKDDRSCFQFLAIMWDKGINSYDKLDKALDIIAAHHSDPEAAIQATKYLIDGAEPELPYNPYKKILAYL